MIKASFKWWNFNFGLLDSVRFVSTVKLGQCLNVKGFNSMFDMIKAEQKSHIDKFFIGSKE